MPASILDVFARGVAASAPVSLPGRPIVTASDDINALLSAPNFDSTEWASYATRQRYPEAADSLRDIIGADRWFISELHAGMTTWRAAITFHAIDAASDTACAKRITVADLWDFATPQAHHALIALGEDTHWPTLHRTAGRYSLSVGLSCECAPGSAPRMEFEKCAHRTDTMGSFPKPTLAGPSVQKCG
jgi:hypothetical protein